MGRLQVTLDILQFWLYNTHMTDKEFAWHVISVPLDIDFLVYRKKYSKTWLTKERKILRIADMSTEHIASCIDLLRRFNQKNTKAYRGLVAEMRKRIDSDYQI